MTQFREFVSLEFGASYGRVLVNDLVLEAMSGLTAQEALDAGVPPRDVWFALCEATDVPRDRWHGRDKPRPSVAAAGRKDSWPAEWPR